MHPHHRKDQLSFQPLAARMRPSQLDDYIGQSHIMGKSAPLRQLIETDRVHSMIFWGPPGTGKTTLAMLIANVTHANFVSISAISSGVKDIKPILDQAAQSLLQEQKRSILFVDEIHRFNKAQQDLFLPYVESGQIILIGATTENPSFELNQALLSRLRVYRLYQHSEEELTLLLERALLLLQQDHPNEPPLTILQEERTHLIQLADGDARQLCNLLDLVQTHVIQTKTTVIDANTLTQLLGTKLLAFDKNGEHFYDLISALHKAVRGTDPDAALYWFSRILQGGGDPRYIGRRLIRMASEDIGNAHPQALPLVIAANDAYERLGSPEGELALAQAVLFLAAAPKSNAVYTAYQKVTKVTEQSGSLPVPLYLRNAPTKLMKDIGYGKTYRYPHDEPNAYAAGETYLPEAIKNKIFYEPTEYGFEKSISERLKHLKALTK